MRIAKSVSTTFLVGTLVLSGINNAFSQATSESPVLFEPPFHNTIENIESIRRSTLSIDRGYSGINDKLYAELFNLFEKNGKTESYYIGSVNQEKGWALISISKLFKSESIKSNDSDGSFLGEDLLVIAKSLDEGITWELAFEKTKKFKDMVNITPDTFLAKSAKNTFVNLEPIDTKIGTLSTTTTVNYKFPWQEFNNKTYSQSWHGTLTPGLDFRSTATDRRILSSAAGTVTNVSICKYSVNVSIRHADGKVFKYLHLNKSEFDSTKIKSGVNLAQGKKLGLLRKGSFSDSCGYANQTSSTHHLHWGLPTNTTNTIDQWSILSPNKCWTKPGYSNRCVGSTFGSTNKEV